MKAIITIIILLIIGLAAWLILKDPDTTVTTNNEPVNTAVTDTSSDWTIGTEEFQDKG